MKFSTTTFLYLHLGFIIIIIIIMKLVYEQSSNLIYTKNI